MSERNRLHNCTNQYQGGAKRVLCVCSAGLLRSPTAAVVLSKPPFNFNTRAAGLITDYALIPVDDVLLTWAQEIVCMTEEQQDAIAERLEQLPDNGKETPIVCLNIQDDYAYRDPKLVKLIAERYKALAPKSKVGDV